MEPDSNNLKNKVRFSKLSRKGRLNLLKENAPKIPCNDIVNSPTAGKSEQVTQFTLDKVNLDKSYSHISTLPNFGSTCFCNAIIQVLRFTPGFSLCLHQITDTKSFWKKGEVPIVLKQLHNLFQELRNGDLNMFDLEETNPKIAQIIRKILNSFSEEHSNYHFGQQYDAHEFLGWILRLANCDINEAMFDKSTNKRILSLGNNFTNFKEQFLEGKSRIYLICLECEEEKWKDETFWDLPYNLSEEPKNELDDQSDKSVDHSLWDQIICKESILQGDHKYWCEKCLHHVEAKHKTVLLDVPKVVIFRPIQAYKTNERNNYGKNFESVLYVPEILPCNKSECVKSCTKHIYKLYGIVVHIGSTLQSGHYVVLLKLSFELKKVHSSLLWYQKEVRVRPVTRLKTESEKIQLKIEDCCLFTSNQAETENEEWILCDDEITKIYENENVNSILDKLGTSATPNMLFYCLCKNNLIE